MCAVPSTPRAGLSARFGAAAMPYSRGGGRTGGAASGGGGGGSGGGSGGADGGGGESSFRFLLRVYLEALDRRPLLVKVLTSAVISCVSDLVAQNFELWGAGKLSWLQQDIDWRRVAALGFVGAVLTAPMFHFLYDAMDAYIPSTRNPLNTVAQLLVDQLIAAPAWLVAFFGLISVCEGRFDLDSVKAQIARDYIPSLKLTWTVFPVVQLLSFAFIPKHLRVLTLNVLDLGFTGALSYIKHAKQESSVLAANPARVQRTF